MRRSSILKSAILSVVFLSGSPAEAFSPDVLESVVRLKPNWSAAARGQNPGGAPRDPQGTGVAIFSGGYVATNVHVIGDATEIDVLLEDGRSLPAAIVGKDKTTDIALLKIDADLPVIETAPPPPLASRVCAIGNQFGLGLSVTCGVVSAASRSGTGFNPVEDFIQTDATVNPGGSGGALIDAESRLVGMVSAIFTKQSDADIGVNFAASARLLLRVTRDLKEYGEVRRASIGFRAGDIPQTLRAVTGGVMVTAVDINGPAFAAGLDAGDLITHVNGQRIPSASAFETQIFMQRTGDEIVLQTQRGTDKRKITLNAK